MGGAGGAGTAPNRAGREGEPAPAARAWAGGAVTGVGSATGLPSLPPLPAPVIPAAQPGKTEHMLKTGSSVSQRAPLPRQTWKGLAFPNADLLARTPELAAAASPARLPGVPPTPRLADSGPRAKGTRQSGHPSPPPTWDQPSAVPGRAAAAAPPGEGPARGPAPWAGGWVGTTGGGWARGRGLVTESGGGGSPSGRGNTLPGIVYTLH